MRSLSSPISKAGWWSLCSPPSAHLRHRSPPWRQEPSMYETRRTGSAEQWSLWWNGNEGDSACRHTQIPSSNEFTAFTFTSCIISQNIQYMHSGSLERTNCPFLPETWNKFCKTSPMCPWSTYVFLIFSEKCSSHIMMSNTQMAY